MWRVSLLKNSLKLSKKTKKNLISNVRTKKLDFDIYESIDEMSDEDLSDSTSLLKTKKKYSSNTKKTHHKKSNNSNRNRKRY